MEVALLSALTSHSLSNELMMHSFFIIFWEYSINDCGRKFWHGLSKNHMTREGMIIEYPRYSISLILGKMRGGQKSPKSYPSGFWLPPIWLSWKKSIWYVAAGTATT